MHAATLMITHEHRHRQLMSMVRLLLVRTLSATLSFHSHALSTLPHRRISILSVSRTHLHKHTKPPMSFSDARLLACTRARSMHARARSHRYGTHLCLEMLGCKFDLDVAVAGAIDVHLWKVACIYDPHLRASASFSMPAACVHIVGRQRSAYPVSASVHSKDP